MADFKPYKNIKEFYNGSRLVLPAIRDMVLNTVFLGKSKEKGETLLDNVNYPFFDLWKMVINLYRYSFWETNRSELLVVPDMMSCLPPICNIVFPDEYVHYGRSIKLRGQVTRYFEQGFSSTVTINGNDELLNTTYVPEQEVFIGPDSDIQPLMGDIIKSECTPVVVEKNEDTDFVAFRQVPLPEEFHYGAGYFTGEGEYLLKVGENKVRMEQGTGSTQNSDALAGEDSMTLVEEYNNYHKLNVLYKYFLTRLQSQKTEQVRLTYTPRLVPGLPVVLMSKTEKHIIGLITNLRHIVSAEGQAETHLNVEYQYLYDDSTKRPLYLYKERNSEKLNIDDKQGYIWKNYFLLSDDFRDNYIGKELYDKILCDGVEDKDYNLFARDFVNKLKSDKSILGIHNVFKDLTLTRKK